MDEEAKRCKLCQRVLTGKKATSDFCGDNHRMRWHRALKRLGERLLKTGIISAEDVRREDAAVNGKPDSK